MYVRIPLYECSQSYIITHGCCQIVLDLKIENVGS